MKVRDLKEILDNYDNSSGMFRKLIANPELEKLRALYDSKNEDKDITEKARALLISHWKAIQGTNRSYLSNRKIEATEQAYLSMAKMLDADGKKSKNSHVKISTLMPSTLSFADKFDISQPVIQVGNRVFQYRNWLADLQKEINVFNESNLINYLLNKYDHATSLQLNEALSKVNESDAKLNDTLNLIKKAVTWVCVNSVIANCVQKSNWKLVSQKIPEAYRFKTKDNHLLDIRILIFTGFINPITNQPIASEDLEKLKSHPRLGFSVITFLNEVSSSLESKDVTPSTDLFHKLFLRFITETSEQKKYDYLCSLIEFVDHIDNHFLPALPQNFKALVQELKTKAVWSDMKDQEFFDKAALVINQVKSEMKEWSHGTDNFFAAMKEFALHTDTVINRSDSSYIKSNGEYLVRVNGTDLTTWRGAKNAIQIQAHQFKTAFHIAYRYGKLPKLMGAMTPPGVCIAEKMRHLVPIFAKIASMGPYNTGLNTLDDVFADIMAKARIEEIRLHVAWGEEHFLAYILKHHCDKTQYLDKDNVAHTLDEETIRNYLVDVMLYDIPRTRSLRA